MCFSSGGGQVKAKPATPLSRFDYNQPTTSRTQQQQVAAANTDTQPAFGSELGSTATPEQRY